MSRRDEKRALKIVGKRELPTVVETLECQRDVLNDSDIAALVNFFKLLDKWDSEVKRNAETM